MKTNNGYKTLYLGSQVDLQQSTTIELVLFTDYQITLNNFKQVWQSLSSHKNIYTSDNHIYTIECGKDNILNFNSIYYLDDNNKPLGCTVFEKPQSTNPLKESYINNLIIEININITDPVLSEVEFSFDLSSYYNNTEIPDRINYPTKSIIKEKLSKRDNYLRYSNNIEQINHDSSTVLITDSNFITKNKQYDLKLPSPFTSLFQGENYTGAQFTYYNLRPCIFLYRLDNLDLSYRLISLTLLNNFGKPTTIFSGELDQFDYEDFYIAGQYLVLTDRLIYDLSSEEITEYQCSMYADSLDYDPQVLPLDTIDEKSNIISIPTDYFLFRKAGPWCIYRNNSSYTWISPFGSIKFSKKERTYLITDRIFLSQEEAEDVDGEIDNFTTIYCVTPEDTLRTNDYFKNDNNFGNSKNYRIIPGCPRKMFCGESGSFKYYGKFVFSFKNKDGLLSNQLIDGLRHAAILDYDIPEEIIGGIGGIIFYVDKDKFIKYL